MFETTLITFGIPFSICVLLPIVCIWLIMRRGINNDNKRAEVLLKAIESNNSIDADKLAEALSKPRLTPREQLNKRLLRGCIWSLVGVALFVLGLITWLTDPDVTFGSDDVYTAFMFGLISFAVGVSYLIVYFVTRKQVDREHEKEHD